MMTQATPNTERQPAARFQRTVTRVVFAAFFLAFTVTQASTAEPKAAIEQEAKARQIIHPGDRTSSASRRAVELAEDGKALLPIVVAADASPSLKATAEYLASRLKKITGAEFSIEPGDGATGIVIGTWKQFAVAALKRPLELRPVIDGVGLHNGVEAYAIRTEAKRLLLLGGADLGASHAVARFLELLGYRQFFPAQEWEVVPSLPTLQFNRNETDRPTILQRHFWYAWGLPRDPLIPATLGNPPHNRAKDELDAWYRQNRLGQSFQVSAAHVYSAIPELYKEEFKAHPEYYMLYDGKREWGICGSNPGVQRICIRYALDYFEKNPKADMVSMEPNDGDKMCQCTECARLGSPSARVFALANIVARGIREKHPGKMVGLLAYNLHSVPPDFAIEPNVFVQLTTKMLTGPYSFEELLALWSKKTRNLGIYDYSSTYQWGQDRFRNKSAAGPTADIAYLQAEMALFKKHGVLGWQPESSIAWGAHGRGNYLATRLTWNPDADPNAVLQDFYDKAFGPAAPAMKRYFERVDGDNEVFSSTLLALAARDVDEAVQLAKDRPDVLARLDQIRQFLYWNFLEYQLMHGADASAKKALTIEKLTHEFRTRYSYMTHWQAEQSCLGDYIREYKDSSWAMPNWSEQEMAAALKEKRELALPPWMVLAPYTRAETDRKWKQVLDGLPLQTILPKVKQPQQ